MLSADHRHRRRQAHASSRAVLPTGRTGVHPGSEDGFMLLEVLMSAFIVGLIVVGTLSGFTVANSTSGDQRRHDQAAVLAAESQEQLRSDPANALEALQNTPHTYTQTLNKTVYTISESAKFINNTTQAATCTAPGEASKQNSSYLQVTSVVTWTATNSTYPKVEQSSVITPPTGSALEVDAVNGASPEVGVPGVLASIEYTGVESTEPTTIEGTTGTLGCVVFGAIPATSAIVNVKPPLGYVTPSDTFKIPTDAATLAPNLTTHKEYTVNQGGAIKGEFTYKGTPVDGETFVAFNAKLAAPQFVLASTSYNYESGGEERYTPLAGTQALTATSPIHTNYPTGNIFPWSEKYFVYAGDCIKNSVKETTNPENLKPEEILVEPGKTVPVKIPLSLVSLTVDSGKSSASPGTIVTEALSVRITNTACKEPTPNDATASLYIHEQKLSSGHLEDPYQPFGGPFSLCVYSGTKKKNYTVTYTNEKQEGATRHIYLEEGTTSEQTVESNPASPC
jgi:Tfp pilus assembly protein PilV